MSQDLCPRCKTPVVIQKGQPGVLCPNCHFAVMLDELQRRPSRQSPTRLILLIALILVMIGACLYVALPLARQLGFDLEWILCPRRVTEYAVEGISSIHTDNYANQRLEYYYYIPRAIVENPQAAYPLLVMTPSLSGRGEILVTQEFKDFAQEEVFIIVSPSFVFDERNWESRQSYQYPSAWSGDALLEIIDQFEKEQDIKTDNKLYIYGFSAGAQFSLRFCLWEPNRCAACAAHASGGSIVPTKKVDAKFFITVGTKDTERIDKAEAFYQNAKKLGIDITYKTYDTGHAITSDQIKDSLGFFHSAR